MAWGHADYRTEGVIPAGYGRWCTGAESLKSQAFARLTAAIASSYAALNWLARHWPGDVPSHAWNARKKELASAYPSR